MRVADYIFKTLADKGARHAFLVVGGGVMQLNLAARSVFAVYIVRIKLVKWVTRKFSSNESLF